MSKRATMTDVAERAGVSQATVSLVLNGVSNARISAATRSRVFAAAEELDYKNRHFPPASPAGQKVIGLFLDEVSATPFATRFIEGARDEAARHDITLALFPTAGNAALEEAALAMLRQTKALGVIYATLLTRRIRLPRHFGGMPLALLNCVEAKNRYPSVTPDDFSGGEAAAELLIAHGHRAIAHLGGEQMLNAARQREAGFRHALARHGVPVIEDFVTRGGWSIRSGRERAHALLSLPRPPSAVFCFNDRMALGCYQAAAEKGLSVPGDLSIVGFDNEDIASQLDPALTTLVLPHDEMARWAVTALVDKSIPAPAASHKIACTLVERASVASAPAGLATQDPNGAS